MTIATFLAVLVFGLISSITPGPNNLMVMTSGANFGLHRSWPHIWGIALGFGVMIFILGLALAGLSMLLPTMRVLLKVVAVVYLLYLAWKIATAAPIDGATSTAQPLSFLQAAAFQWVNPKAWASAVTAVAAYSPSGSFLGAVLIAVAFIITGLPSVTLWCVMGQELRRLLDTPARLRAFNITMAILLLLTLIPIVMV
ncbi:transporter LysE family protein [Ketogulonicigenium robustum]|uniref:Transporter LysE family protein n=1 Tax=Ketogulonicigenium robustum TaxID=92947 RepID=A0A1W6P0K4_9RHOB|nr:LysE family translocator [Ketogulonicigenium robustum]ARO14931.1 transporter LysE family protein [Ketogulonicigenium robustum]